MRILIDGMGGDNAPDVIVEGAIMATEFTQEELCIIGIESEIRELIKKYGYKGDQISIVNATQISKMMNRLSKLLGEKKIHQ